MLGSITSFLLTLLIVGLTFFVTLDIYKKRRIFKFASRFGGYRFYPIIGNGYHLIGKNLLTSFEKLVNTYKLPCSLWAGHMYIYLTNVPAEIKVILNHPNTVERSEVYQNFYRIFERSLLMEPYEEWKIHRKLFSKSFNQRALNNLVGSFYKKSCKMVDTMRDGSNKLSIDLFKEYTLNVITDNFSGQEGQFSPEDSRKIIYGIDRLQVIIGKRMLTAAFYPDWLFFYSSEGRGTLKTLDDLKGALCNIIQTKRALLEKAKDSSVDDETLPLIDRLMRNESKLSDEDISSQLFLFILAAIDTTSTSIAFALTLLGMYPEIQEKVYQEVIETVGLTNPITQNDLPNLKYTEMAIFETLRLLPTIPAFGRYATDDVDLGTTVIPAGCNIYISAFHLHRDEKLWKNPLEYNPDRFLPEEVANRDPYAFVPFSAGPKNCIDLHTSLQKLVKKYSLPCNIWIGHDYSYMTADASEVKIVLNHPRTFDKSSIYENVRTAFGKTLLMAEADHWKRNRKIFAKSFSQPILNSFVDTFYRKSCTLMGILKASQDADIFEIFDKFSLDNFCANLMRLDLEAQVNMGDEITALVRGIQDTIGKRMLSSYFFPESLWMYTPEGRITKNDYERLKEIIFHIIQKKRQVFSKNGDFRECGDKLPLMDMLLDVEGVTFTDEEIFQEIFLFLLAATDTSGITLAFTCTLLGMNPDAQEKIYQEVIQQVGADNPIDYSDLPNLKYTERAIFESMRLLPVVPVLGRRATADIDLGTRTVPAGSNIMLSIFNLHRSERYWNDPLRYNPDRFLPEETAKRDPYAFIPFSSGQRNCIGMKYALMMMKTAVAQIVRSFHIRSKYRSVEDMELESCITMKTVHELDCNFIPRHRFE